MDKQSFIFAPPSPSAPKVVAAKRVLGIRSLQVAAPFEGRAFVYRSGEFSYDRDPYAEFMVYPADGLVSPICGWWRRKRAALARLPISWAARSNRTRWLRFTSASFYGDFRQPEHAAAILAMRFVFLDAPNDAPGKVVMQRDYTREIPLKARTAEALIEGWNQALAQILDSAMQDFGKAAVE